MNHIHYKFTNIFTLEKMKEILTLFLEDKAISPTEFADSLEQFKKYESSNEDKIVANTTNDKIAELDVEPAEEHSEEPKQKKSKNIGGPQGKPNLFKQPQQTSAQKSSEPSNSQGKENNQGCSLM